MIGHLQPPAANRCDKSTPVMPPIWMSITRQAALRDAVALRNAPAESKVSAAKPNADRSCAVARRVPGSWSTTATILGSSAADRLMAPRGRGRPTRPAASRRDGGDNYLLQQGNKRDWLDKRDFLPASCYRWPKRCPRMPPRQPLMPRLRARRPGMAVVDLEANRLGGLPSAVGGIARLAYARARAAGLDVDPLLSQASLTREQIEDSGLRLRVRDQIKFLNLVADALPDDLLGFHLAQVCELRAIGLLYYVAASSDTLGEVLKRASRYSTIVNEGVSLTCTSNGDIGIT